MDTSLHFTGSKACKLPRIVKFACIRSPKMKPYSVPLSNGSVIHVYDGQFIQLLSEALRISYDILPSPDNQFGIRLPNGDWSGMIGMVKRGETHIAVGSISQSEDRLNAVRFSYPYHITEVTFVTDNPQPLLKSLAIFHPFSYELWIMLIISVTLISLLFYVMLKRKHTYDKILLKTMGYLLEQSVYYKNRSPSFLILTLSWTFGALVVTSSYKATLLSFLSIPTTTGIRDISDLSKAVAKESFQCRTYSGSYLSQQLVNSSDENFRAIGNCLMRGTMNHMGIEEYLKNRTYQKAFLGGRSYIVHFKEHFFISQDSFFTNRIAMPISESFQCTSKLNAAISQLAAGGFYLKQLREREFFYKRYVDPSASEESEININHLTLEDLYGTFLFLIFGYSSALVALIGEIIAEELFKRK